MIWKVVYTNHAANDLRSIYEYIAFSLLEVCAAQRICEQITKEIRALEFMPTKFPLYQDEPWRSAGIRSVPVKNYVVFYTVDEQIETVTVLRIMYGGRDLSNIDDMI